MTRRRVTSRRLAYWRVEQRIRDRWLTVVAIWLPVAVALVVAIAVVSRSR